MWGEGNITQKSQKHAKNALTELPVVPTTHKNLNGSSRSMISNTHFPLNKAPNPWPPWPFLILSHHTLPLLGSHFRSLDQAAFTITGMPASIRHFFPKSCGPRASHRLFDVCSCFGIGGCRWRNKEHRVPSVSVAARGKRPSGRPTKTEGRKTPATSSNVSGSFTDITERTEVGGCCVDFKGRFI